MDNDHSDVSNSLDSTPRRHVRKLRFDIPENEVDDNQRPAVVLTRDDQISFGSLSDGSDCDCRARLTRHPNMSSTLRSFRCDHSTAGVSPRLANQDVTKRISDSDSGSASLDAGETRCFTLGLGEDDSWMMSNPVQETRDEEIYPAVDSVCLLDEGTSSGCDFTRPASRVFDSAVESNELFGFIIGHSTLIEELSSAACDVPSTLDSSRSMVSSSDNTFSCVEGRSDIVDELSGCICGDSTSFRKHFSPDHCKINSFEEQISSILSANVGLHDSRSFTQETSSTLDGSINSIFEINTCAEAQLRSSQVSTNIPFTLCSPVYDENECGFLQSRSRSCTNNNLHGELCCAQEKVRTNNEQSNSALSTATMTGHSSNVHNKSENVDKQVHSISSSEDCNYEQETTIGVHEQSSFVKRDNKSSKEQVKFISGNDHFEDEHINLIQAVCNSIHVQYSDVDNCNCSLQEHDVTNIDEKPSSDPDRTGRVDGHLNSISSTATSQTDQLSSVRHTTCVIHEQLSSTSCTTRGTEVQISWGSEAASCTSSQAGRPLGTVVTDDDSLHVSPQTPQAASESLQENILCQLGTELEPPPTTEKQDNPPQQKVVETNEVLASLKSKNKKQRRTIPSKHRNGPSLDRQLTTFLLQHNEQTSYSSDGAGTESSLSDGAGTESSLSESIPTLTKPCCGCLVSPSPESVSCCATCVLDLKLEATPIMEQPTVQTPNTVSSKREKKKSARISPAPNKMNPNAGNKGTTMTSGAYDSCQPNEEAATSSRAAGEMPGQELPVCCDPTPAAALVNTQETASGPDGLVFAPLPAMSKKKKKTLRKLENQNTSTEKEEANKRPECIAGPSVEAKSQKGCCKPEEDVGATPLVKDIPLETFSCGPPHKTNVSAEQNGQTCGKRKAKKKKKSKLPLETRGVTNTQTPADNIDSAKAQELILNCPFDFTSTEENTLSESSAVLPTKIEAKGRKSGPHSEGRRVPACSQSTNRPQKAHLPQTAAAGSVPHGCLARSGTGQGLMLPAPATQRPVLSGYSTGVQPGVAAHFSPNQLGNQRNLIQIRTFPGNFNRKRKLQDTDFYNGHQIDNNNGSTVGRLRTQESNRPSVAQAVNDASTQQQSDSFNPTGANQRNLDNESSATFDINNNPVHSVAYYGGGQMIQYFHPNHVSGYWKQNRSWYSEPMLRNQRDFHAPAHTAFRPFNKFIRYSGQFNAGQVTFRQVGGPRHVLFNSQDFRQGPASRWGAYRAHPTVGRIDTGDTGDIGYRAPRNDPSYLQWKRRRQTPESGAEEHNNMPSWKRRKQTVPAFSWSSPESYQREFQMNTGPASLQTASVPLSMPHQIIWESPASPESSSSLLGSFHQDLRSLTPVSQPSQIENSDIPASRTDQRIPANYGNPEIKCRVCFRSGLTLWSRCAHVQVCTSCLRDDSNRLLTCCSVCQVLSQKP